MSPRINGSLHISNRRPLATSRHIQSISLDPPFFCARLHFPSLRKNSTNDEPTPGGNRNFALPPHPVPHPIFFLRHSLISLSLFVHIANVRTPRSFHRLFIPAASLPSSNRLGQNTKPNRPNNGEHTQGWISHLSHQHFPPKAEIPQIPNMSILQLLSCRHSSRLLCLLLLFTNRPIQK